MTMRAVIGENTKSDIIKQWMSGKSRDAIALSSGVSAGVVSKVVANWKTAIDVHVADDLREMAVTLRKLELSPSECAIGARVYKIIKSMGLNEENELEFLSDTYKQTRELGIAPQAIADSLRELVDLTATVSVIEMPGYLMQKRHEKLELEDEILELKSQQVAAKKFAEDALNQHRVTVSELQNYSNFKKEMAHNEISIDDIAKFMNMVNVIKKTTDFHPAVVLSRFHTLSEIDIGKILLDQLKGEINQLNEEIKQLKDEKDAHIQSSKTYKELESLGMGLKELRFLRNTIREIASENGIPPSFAVRVLFTY